MSLVQSEKKAGAPSWRDRDLKRNLRHIIPGKDSSTKAVDYDFLKSMCQDYEIAPGSKEDRELVTNRHKHFMKNYHRMFLKKPSSRLPEGELPALKQSTALGLALALGLGSSDLATGLGVSKLSLATHATGGYSTGGVSDKKSDRPLAINPVNNMSHDIRDYVADLHRQRIMHDPENIFTENIKTLRRLSRKMPFDRTASDNDKMFRILKTFSQLTNQVSDFVLRELCVIAVIDIWREVNFTVFGNSGLHLIVKGSVSVCTEPHLRTDENEKDFRVPTPPPLKQKDILTVGDCFGTLKCLEGRGTNSKVLTVITEEPNCEFIRISCTEYKRVIKQIHQKDQTEKMNLLSSCQVYKLWPPQPLSKLANLIEWINFPSNTVLVSEGFKAPSIFVIKSGECHVLREVEKKHMLPNGKVEIRNKQVVMGKVGENESFGEISLLTDESMTCSIITSTSVQMATIDSDKLKELDDVTLQLIKQSSSPTFADFTQDEIYEEYMNQELKREWNEFKHNVVVDVINSRGVRPGYGKWSK